MKLGMLAIGMSILIAASALVMVASAAKEPTITVNGDTITFSGFSDGDNLLVTYKNLDGGNQHRYTYEWHNRNQYRVQFAGNDTYSTGAEYVIELDVGTYEFKASAPNNVNKIEPVVGTVTIT